MYIINLIYENKSIMWLHYDVYNSNESRFMSGNSTLHNE